jgi:hypothetical protein
VTSVVAGIGFVGSVLLAGLLDPAYSQASEAISALASVESRSAGVMTVGFLLLATAAGTAGCALWLTLDGRLGRTGAVLVVVAGAATVVVAFARQSCSTLQQSCLDRERAGTVSDAHVVHNLVALGSFTLLVVAGFLHASAVRRDSRFRSWSLLARSAAVCSLVLMVWFGSGSYGDVGGLVQRVLVLTAYGLPVVLAWRVTGPVPNLRGSRA